MMDDAALEAAFRSHVVGQIKFTRRMAITIALMSGETPRHVVRRLEGLNLLYPGSWEWFVANGGITSEQISEVKSALSRGMQA